MEKAIDFFKEIGIRFKSPLILSFVIAWLITNWHITIGVLFCNSQQLQLDGYNSYIDLINKNKSTTNFWIYPLTCSLIYALVFPVIRNMILAYNAFSFRWGSKLSLRAAKEGWVSFNRYIELKSQLQKSIEEVHEIHKKEKLVVAENEWLNEKVKTLGAQFEHEKQSLNQSKDEFQKELEALRMKSNTYFFNGSWSMKFKKEDGKVLKERVVISSGNITYSNEEANNEVLFVMKVFAYNPNSNEYVILFDSPKDTSAQRFAEILRPQDQTFNFFKNHEKNGIVLELERLTM